MEHPSIDEARKELKAFGQLEPATRLVQKDAMLRAFETFWYSNPKRVDFRETMKDIPLSWDILYIMIRSR